MIDCDDYFGGLTEEEYEDESKKHLEYLEHLQKVDYEQAYRLVDKFKDSLFATESVDSKEADMLYHTILNWKDKSDMYDGLCD